jgi:hypothetical protein
VSWGEPLPVPAFWSRGPWSLERAGDELTNIRFDGSLVLRSARAVVRDRDWNTVPVEVLSVSDDHDLRLELRWRGFGGEFAGTLVVSDTGSALTMTLDLDVLTDFERNRIGLVLLHPPTLAGLPMQIRHADGALESSAFPDRISPHPPAFDIGELAWSHDGVDTRATFAGDVFEMEDQRNWTDASYKTYSTPLAIPYPVRVAAGEKVTQAIELRSVRVAPHVPSPISSVVRLVRAQRRIPSFGLTASTAPDPLPAHEAVGDFLLVELEASQPNWPAALARAVAEADGLPLDVRIAATEPAQVRPVIDALQSVPVVRVGVFSRDTHVTEPDLWTALVDAAADSHLKVDLVGGARTHFTELNRENYRLPALPAFTFSSTPQMHAREVAQLIESIPIQRLTAQNAVALAGEFPVHVGPVTLRPRVNSVLTSEPVAERIDLSIGYGAQHVPGSTDPRQSASAIAAWLIASASAFSIPGVDSVTFFETVGERGLVDAAGQPTPAASAFWQLAGLSGKAALEPTSPLPLNTYVIGADDTVLVANLNAEPISLTLELDGSETTADVDGYGFVAVATSSTRR